MLCRYVKPYALTLEYFVHLINVFEIHKISVNIANKRQEEKLATSTYECVFSKCQSNINPTSI